MDTIILIGMPGAGKSTVGVVLAKMMGKDFLDIDLLIQKKHGKTLQQLIDGHGAEGFIELEGEVLGEVAAENAVIATGGSAVYSDAGMRHLADIGCVVYLEISYDSLVDRLGDLDERGVVMRDNCTGLQSLYEERLPLYRKYAQVEVDVDGLTITQAAGKVREAVRNR